MINRIRDRITKHYAASRSLMAAKKLKAKPTKEEDDDEEEEEKKPKAEEKEAKDKESKFDETSTFKGKYPLTKFYGNNPVVVYYVPIISGSGSEKELNQIPDDLPGVDTLRSTVRKKLEELQKKQRN